jgi:hypothetical protein
MCHENRPAMGGGKSWFGLASQGIVPSLGEPLTNSQKEWTKRGNDHHSHKKRRPEGRRFVLPEAFTLR